MNVRARQVLYFLLVSALFQACHGRSTTRSSTDGVQGPLRRSTALCPGADTLRYSNLLANDETGDLSGFMITLVSANGRWTGYSQEAAGELGGPVSLVALRVDTGANGVSSGCPAARTPPDS